MPKWLRAWDALVPSTHITGSQVSMTQIPGSPKPSSGLDGHQVCVWYTSKSMSKTLIHRISLLIWSKLTIDIQDWEGQLKRGGFRSGPSSLSYWEQQQQKRSPVLSSSWMKELWASWLEQGSVAPPWALALCVLSGFRFRPGARRKPPSCSLPLQAH